MIIAPGYATKSQFADEHLKCSRSYVTALAKSGRLVTNEHGHIHVEQSLALIGKTTGAPERGRVTSTAFGEAKDAREYYQAENARLDYEERCGRLMQADGVVQAISSAATTVRARLEVLPDQLAPQIAGCGGDEQRIKALLAEQIEAVLVELSSGFNGAAIGAKQ